MNQLIEMGFQESISRGIEPNLIGVFTPRSFTPNINLSRGLPVIHYIIQLLDITTKTCYLLDIEPTNQPTTHLHFHDLLKQLLSLEMLNIENITNQECGLKPEAHTVIQMLIGGIVNNL
jgi:hypothetical protein